ncbi:hypothetical protein BDW72DRAFT_176621 [Aspergillus terricola var. indicus]
MASRSLMLLPEHRAIFCFAASSARPSGMLSGQQCLPASKTRETTKMIMVVTRMRIMTIPTLMLAQQTRKVPYSIVMAKYRNATITPPFLAKSGAGQRR